MIPHTIRRATVAVAATVVALTALAGCSSGGGAAPTTDPKTAKGTISLWHYYTDREAGDIQTVVNDFEKQYPGVKVEVHSGQSYDKVAQVIASGGGVDVVLLGGGDNLGSICSSGAFSDLGPYLKKDAIPASTFVQGPFLSSKFDGKQCSLPSMSDVYGLYYNTALLKAAGYTAPPRTLDELETMALKMTTYNPDGSIKTLGFDPLMGFYENQATSFSAITGANWMKGGKSTISSDPAWTDLMTWQKDLVDKIGYNKLKAFTAGLGDEWSANNAFQTGQVAMNLDGEWRGAFIDSQAPNLQYGTAPFPTGSGHENLYGSGLSMSSYVGISSKSKNADLAWLLTKYLATDTKALVYLTNQLQNIPTTYASLHSSGLKISSQFKTFMNIAGDKKVYYVPQTSAGATPVTTMQNYWEQYQAGNGGDLATGLKTVDKTINDAISLGQ